MQRQELSRADKLESFRAQIASIETGSHACGIDPLFSSSKENQAKEPACKHADGSSAFDNSSGSNKCKQRLEELCSYSEYSVKKMRNRLLREKFSVAEVEEALSFAIRCNLINDERFGELLVHSRMRAGKGMYGIEEELFSHDINPSSVEGWPHAFSEVYGSEMERAVEVLKCNPPRSKNPRQTAYRRLVTKGYKASIAIDAISDWIDAN